jgi:hypothetical protein
VKLSYTGTDTPSQALGVPSKSVLGRGTAKEQICKRFANGWSASRWEAVIRACLHWVFWSERRDLNSGPPVPQTGALTGLRYAPNIGPHYSWQGLTPQLAPARRRRTTLSAAP